MYVISRGVNGRQKSRFEKIIRQRKKNEIEGKEGTRKDKGTKKVR